jgi:hypothetical protein
MASTDTTTYDLSWINNGRGLWKNPYTGEVVWNGSTPPSEALVKPSYSSVADQIMAQGLSGQWQGQGFGSAYGNAMDMAKILSGIGITDIKQFGEIPTYTPVQMRYVYQGETAKQNPDGTFSVDIPVNPDSDYPSYQTVTVPANAVTKQYGTTQTSGNYDAFVSEFVPVDPSKVTTQNGQLVAQTGTTYGNKETGQVVPNTYSERQTGNAWGGTYAGEGSTGYRVQFGPDGTPYFYTTYQDTSDKADLLPLLAVAGAALTGGTSLGLLGAEGAIDAGAGFLPIGGTAGTALTPAAIESGLGTAGYGVSQGALASGLFDASTIGAGAGAAAGVGALDAAGAGAAGTGTASAGAATGSSAAAGSGVVGTSGQSLAMKIGTSLGFSDPLAARVAGNALLQGSLSSAMGGNFVTGAITGGIMGGFPAQQLGSMVTDGLAKVGIDLPVGQLEQKAIGNAIYGTLLNGGDVSKGITNAIAMYGGEKVAYSDTVNNWLKNSDITGAAASAIRGGLAGGITAGIKGQDILTGTVSGAGASAVATLAKDYLVSKDMDPAKAESLSKSAAAFAAAKLSGQSDQNAYIAAVLAGGSAANAQQAVSDINKISIAKLGDQAVIQSSLSADALQKQLEAAPIEENAAPTLNTGTGTDVPPPGGLPEVVGSSGSSSGSSAGSSTSESPLSTADTTKSADATTGKSGYYDEVTGKFIESPLGGLPAPLTNETSGTGTVGDYTNVQKFDDGSTIITDKDGNIIGSTPATIQINDTGAKVEASAGAAPVTAGSQPPPPPVTPAAAKPPATPSGGLPTTSGGGYKDPTFTVTPQFLAAAPVTGSQSQEGQEKLHQLFSSLTPALAAVMAERGFAPNQQPQQIKTPSFEEQAAMYGYRPDAPEFFAGGGGVSTGQKLFDETQNLMNSMAPKFTVKPGMLEAAPVQEMKSRLSGLTHLAQGPLKAAKPLGGLAHGGLPDKYSEAAPRGHKPEFITGLTGYYAQGDGTGQSDDIPAMLHDGDYVMDAEAVSALGDGSSNAGAQALAKFQHAVPHRDGGPVYGRPVAAKIADGEYVFPEAFVTALGGGDNRRGSHMLDAMREELREHKRSAPNSKIPPKAKSPLDYLRMAKG